MVQKSSTKVGYRLINALCFSGWTGSTAFTVREMFTNAMTSYYLIIMATMHSWERHGKKCWEHFLPHVTTINLLKMVSHLILRLCGWPSHIHFEPSCCMEDSVEFWFGTLKSFKRGVHGTCSTSNAIQATQLQHLKQASTRRQASACRSLPFSVGMNHAELVLRSLSYICHYFPMFSLTILNSGGMIVLLNSQVTVCHVTRILDSPRLVDVYAAALLCQNRIRQINQFSL